MGVRIVISSTIRRCTAAALVAVLAGPGATIIAEPVAGIVYLDANADGNRDPGEKGLAGVGVTDGRAFAETDAAGRYALDARTDRLMPTGARPIVRVTCPTGHWPTAPWFVRLEDAADTAAVDFGLRIDEQPLPFTFVHGTDPHVPRGGRHVFPAFRRDVAALDPKPRFCILTGDLVNLSDRQGPETARADFAFLARGMKGFPVPLFCLPGNHDVAGVQLPPSLRAKWAKSPEGRYYGLYRKTVGPLRWSFNYGGVHFVGLDFNEHDGKAWRWRPPAHAVAWLKADLDRVPKGAEVLLFVHYPGGQRALGPVVRDRNIRHIFAGHSHSQGPMKTTAGTAIAGGAIAPGGSKAPAPSGFHLVTVSEKAVTYKYLPINLDAKP